MLLLFCALRFSVVCFSLFQNSTNMELGPGSVITGSGVRFPVEPWSGCQCSLDAFKFQPRLVYIYIYIWAGLVYVVHKAIEKGRSTPEGHKVHIFVRFVCCTCSLELWPANLIFVRTCLGCNSLSSHASTSS